MNKSRTFFDFEQSGRERSGSEKKKRMINPIRVGDDMLGSNEQHKPVININL